MKDGLNMPEETRSHETSVEIEASPSQIWEMITESAGIARWFAPEVKAEQGVGGKVFVSWGGGMEINTLVTQWEPEVHVRWEDPERAPLATDFYIETKDGGTAVLRVVQSFGIGAEWDGEFDGTKHGWLIFVRVIKLAIERHWGKKSFHTSLIEMMPEGSTKAGAWEKLQSQAGIVWDVESSREPSELVVLVPAWKGSLVWFTLAKQYVAASLITYGLEQTEFEEARAKVGDLMKQVVAT